MLIYLQLRHFLLPHVFGACHFSRQSFLIALTLLQILTGEKQQQGINKQTTNN